MSDKLIIALDLPHLKEAETLVKKLSGLVKIFKIGKELFTSAGPEAVRMVHSYEGKVFLDLKFHDIPNTVGAACEAATRLKVFMLNVHSLGGKNMMFRAVQSVHQAAAKDKIKPPRLLAVTVLTSMKDADMKEVGIKKKLKDEALDLAILASKCGLDGVVASGQEIEFIRQALGKNFLIVTPGVRPVWAAPATKTLAGRHDDQKRIVTPREAIEKGADFIVVGRPVTEHPNPRIAARKILEEIS